MDPIERARDLLPFLTVWGAVILAPLAALLASVLVFQLAWRAGKPPDDPDLHWTERARHAWAGRVLLWRAWAVCTVGTVVAAMMVAGPVPVPGPFALAAGAGVGVWLLLRAYSIRHRRRWLDWLDDRTARRGARAGFLTLWLTLLPTFAGLLLLPEDPGPGFFAVLVPLLLVFGFGACGGGVLVARWLGLARAAPPEIREAVEEAARAAGGKTPRVFLVELGFANAYALPILNTVVVSERAAAILTLPEIREMAGHEVSHLNEPRRVTAMRVAGLAILLVVMGTRPLTAHLGPGGFLLLLALAFLLRLRTVRMGRRMESVADGHAHGEETEDEKRVYAAALEKLYRDNLTPAVIGKKLQTHPDLYDRLVAAGAAPDYPRPEPPPRSKKRMVPSVLLAVAVPVLLVILQFGPSVRRPGTEAETLHAIALTGGSPWLLADMGSHRLGAGDAAAAVVFLEAAEFLDPRWPEIAAWLARALAATGDEAGAVDALGRAEALLPVGAAPEPWVEAELAWSREVVRRRFPGAAARLPWPRAAEGNFALRVSNRSIDLSPVDITVTIDGRRAVSGAFECEDESDGMERVFTLPPGNHVLRAVSMEGEASLEVEFAIVARHSAELVFWYYAPRAGRKIPRKFTFEFR